MFHGGLQGNSEDADTMEKGKIHMNIGHPHIGGSLVHNFRHLQCSIKEINAGAILVMFMGNLSILSALIWYIPNVLLVSPWEKIMSIVTLYFGTYFFLSLAYAAYWMKKVGNLYCGILFLLLRSFSK